MRALLISAKNAFSYWSLPESAKFTGTKALNPPLGLITAAALLPHEWEIKLVDLNTRKLTNDEFEWADIVLISAMLTQRASLLEVVREAKQLGKPVVAGGPYPTAVPQELLDAGVDFLVRGEGENTIPLLLDALKEGNGKRVFEAHDKPDMMTSPLPRYDLLRLDDYQIIVVQTSRGCPFNCEFCDIVSLYGRKTRYKTPDQILAELEILHRLGWRGTIFVGDDNFIGSRNHAKAILEKLIPWNKGRGEPFGFFAQASVNLGQDLEMIDLLTAANFGGVFVGIESPDAEVLKYAGKHQNVRNPLAESLAAINRNGLGIIGSFMIGFDNERKGADYRISHFVEQLDIPVVMVNMLVALPGTNLWNRLERENRLLEESIIGQDVSGDRMNFVPVRPEEEIYDEFVRIWDYLYKPERFLARASRYFQNMRPTRAAMGLEKSNGTTLTGASRAPLRIRLRYLRGFLRLLWLQGIRPSYRRHFWKNLYELYRKNPSRVESYLHACGFGENMFRIREMLLERRESGNNNEVASTAIMANPRVSSAA